MDIQRSCLPEVQEMLRFFPAIGIVGPRQVGKTTLAKQLAGGKKKSIYLDLETARDRARLTDPYLYLKDFEDHLVILDEIQFMPELLNELRSLIDEKRKPGRFIILGSASPELIRKSADSLAGRIGYFELTPFLQTEIAQNRHDQLWLRGGFPDSFTAKSDSLSFLWRKTFVKSYVERDLPQLGLAVDAFTLERFWRMLANFHGNLWNAENFGRALGVTGNTVNRYLNFMENAFLLHRLYPYANNLKKRLVKSPKIYLTDSGVLHYLSDIENKRSLQQTTIIGASWEGHVIEQIIRQGKDRFQYYFYRTHQGAECDLVLEKGGRIVAAIEIKYSSAPTLTKGLGQALDDLKPKKSFVVVPGSGGYKLSRQISVVSLSEFLNNELST